jgi:ribose 5-phosphate isomerase RpiB
MISRSTIVISICTVLIGLGGVHLALIGLGALLLLLVCGVGAQMLKADAAADVPLVEIQLLRSIPIFAPLPAPALETLARSLEPMSVTAGTVVIREGEPGDRYYAIASGSLRATASDGKELSVRGRGEGVGEIALIRRVARTATVTAVTDAQLFSLHEEPFLLALTGYPSAAAVAETVVTDQIGTPDDGAPA